MKSQLARTSLVFVALCGGLISGAATMFGLDVVAHLVQRPVILIAAVTLVLILAVLFLLVRAMTNADPERLSGAQE